MYFVYPPFQAWVTSLFGGTGGYSAIGFRLYFTDGSYQDASGNSFSVSYGGKTLDRVEITVTATVVADNVGSWQTSTVLNTNYTISGEGSPKGMAQNSGSMAGSSWTSGEQKTIYSHIELASELDTIFGQRTSLATDWIVSTQATVGLTATIGGQSQTASASSPVASLTLHYSGHSTLQGFSVSVSMSPLTLG